MTHRRRINLLRAHRAMLKRVPRTPDGWYIFKLDVDCGPG